MKKCPVCNSTRVRRLGSDFHCKKCGYTLKGGKNGVER